MQPPVLSIEPLVAALTEGSAFPEVLFAVLVGSRINGKANKASDWDIAVQWSYRLMPLERIGRHEQLRRKLAKLLQTTEDKVDLIDLSDSQLAMKAVVAEEGLLLFVNDELAWANFLTRTWRELEDYYWDRDHAA